MMNILKSERMGIKNLEKIIERLANIRLEKASSNPKLKKDLLASNVQIRQIFGHLLMKIKKNAIKSRRNITKMESDKNKLENEKKKLEDEIRIEIQKRRRKK